MISPDISKEDVEEGPLVDGFLLGLPKCGTTWLANILSQNPSIAFSEPKEPNIIATHRGTFGRTLEEPNLEEYGKVFSGGGFRVDGSVHAFSCPLAPERVFCVIPQVRTHRFTFSVSSCPPIGIDWTDRGTAAAKSRALRHLDDLLVILFC